MNNEIIYDKVNNEFICADGQSLGIANLMWHIIGACNLSCDHCFAQKSKNKFDVSKLELFVKIFKNLGVKKIDLSGGEPLLFGDLDKVCFALKENDIPFTITSSGFVGSDKQNWLLDNHELFARVILSVNAPNAAIHEGINHGKGSFDSVCGLAKRLSERNALLRINTVCTEKICNADTAKEFVEFINRISPIEWCVIQEYCADESVTRRIYDDFLREINKQALSPKIKLITREKKLYRDYYVLDESGFLYLRGKEDKRLPLESPDIEKFLEENCQ